MRDPKTNILLVDDEEDIIDTLYDVFLDEYNVLKCYNANDAMEILKKEDIAVIIADQKMPGMTGIAFLTEARTIKPNTIRILLTGYTELQAGIDAARNGILHKYIEKPWDDDTLLKIVAGFVDVYYESA